MLLMFLNVVIVAGVLPATLSDFSPSATGPEGPSADGRREVLARICPGVILGIALLMCCTGMAGASVSQVAYLKAETPGAGNRFGEAVAISGDTAIVGSPEAGISSTGNVTVYTRNPDGSWTIQVTLTGSNTEAGDRFGSSVALSGNTLVVGARDEASSATGVDGNEADNSLSSPGAAYVFVRDTGGNWTQQAYLKSSSPGPEGFDDFGASVAIDGDRIVVGDLGKGSVFSPPQDAGAAFVFERSGTTWEAVATLFASNPQEFADFGNAVSISGDRIVVGARDESSEGSGINADQSSSGFNGSGAAYEFVRDVDGNWNQTTFFKASNAEDGDQFGSGVSLDGDTLVVGARGEESGIVGDQSNNSAVGSGAAYVFVRDSSGEWSQQAYLKASSPGISDSFGFAVAINGDYLLVGAQNEDSAATGIGGDESDDTANESGSAYLFQRDTGGNWSQQAYIKASNTDPGDRFGWSVDVAGEAQIVGAIFEDSATSGNEQDDSAENAGAAYIFTRGSVAETFTVGGSVTDLPNTGIYGPLVLQNNGTDDLELTDAGSFTFETPLEDGAAYAVTVFSEPVGHVCSVANGGGDIAGADVTGVEVACSEDGAERFDVGGTISGLVDDNTISIGLRIQTAVSGKSISGQGNGPWAFPDSLPDGTDYVVTVNSVPFDQECIVENGTGTIAGADVDDVVITCETLDDPPPESFDIGGTVSGLEGDNTISIRLLTGGSATGGSVIGSVGNRAWAFRDRPDGTEYQIHVRGVDFPEDQFCLIENATGTIDGADVDNVTITCAPRVTSLVATGDPGSATVDLVTNDGIGIGCSLDTAVLLVPSLGGPENFELPLGVVDFSAIGCLDDEITIEVTFDDEISGSTWFKFIGGAWQELPGVTIGGSTARFTIADNGPFDADPAPGTIRDPSGPGFPTGAEPGPGPDAPAQAIPTLNPALLAFLAALLAMVGVSVLRHRFG